eukprot:TRINITY_DN5927_c0_g1_i5.p1 TRINITY_DN5927_c0_g1~~TRINITY_DN5927_c0_g1_i5.p1  ORF type:complete len:710 (-),score=63.67 TRINITY_DN5927_c0_g1_i5:927-3056(-)
MLNVMQSLSLKWPRKKGVQQFIYQSFIVRYIETEVDQGQEQTETNVFEDMKTAKEYVQYLEQYGHQLTSPQLSQALRSVAQFSYSPWLYKQQAVQTLARVTAYKVDELTPDQIAHFLFAFEKIRQKSRYIVELYPHIACNAADFSPHALSKTISSLSKLKVGNPPYDELSQATLTRLDDIDTNFIASIIFSFAKAGYLNLNLMQKVQEHLFDKLNSVTSRDIAAIAWAFGKLQVYDSQFFDRLCSEMMNRFSELDHKNVAMFLNGLWYVKHYDKACMSSLAKWISMHMDEFQQMSLSKSLLTFTNLGHYEKDFFTRVCRFLEPRLQYLQADELSTFMHCIQVLNHKDEQFNNSMGNVVAHKVSKMTPEQLATITRSFAYLKSYHEDMFKAVARASLAMYQTYQLQDIVQLTSAFAIAKFQDHALLSAFAVQICKKQSELSPSDTAQISNAYGSLAHYDSVLMDCLCRKGISVLEGGTGALVMQYLNGIVTLGAELNSLIQVLDSQQLRDLASGFLDTNQLVELMRLLTYVDYWDKELWSILLERTWWLNPQLAKSDTLVQLYQVKQIAELVGIVQFPNLPQDTLREMQASHSRLKNPSVSKWQYTIYTTLRSMGYEDLQLEYKMLGGVFSIDVLLNYKGYKIALELDGPFHFSQNCPYVPLGITKRRNRLLEKMGFRVVTISVYEWSALELGHKYKYELLMEKLEAATY